MNDRILFLINAASLAYAGGSLEHAKKQALEALSMLEPEYSDKKGLQDDTLFSSYFNVLTLLQSIASRQHDLDTYEKYEAPVKELMFQMFGTDSRSYYATHLIDACECYLSAGDIVSAQWFLENAIQILEEDNGSCALISFLHALYHAKLHFHMEQYYECIDKCLHANTLCLTEPIIPPDATAFLQRYAANTELLDKLVYSNLILVSCAYGKINNSEEGIPILTELRKTPPKDYYLHASMDLVLAELYTRMGKYDEARSLCEPYLTQDLKDYPDMLSALTSLSFTLSLPFDALKTSLFTAENDGALPASFCYSRDAFQILLYNHGLVLIEKEKYNDALELYHNLGDKGISLKLVLLAKTGNFKAIPECKKAADRYYYRQIDWLFLYYNEKYVYNHLSMLEYHFSLCMDAYLSCHEALGREYLTPESIYDFLLNTKYISLEASYLSHHFRTLDALKNRKPITAGNIMKLIPKDTALLEFTITKTLSTQDYCVFLVTSSGISCIRLADCLLLDELTDEWHRLLAASVHTGNADMEQLAEIKNKQRSLDTKLRRLLYRPIKELLAALPAELSIKHLVIAPAGTLIQFPFSRLSVSANSYLGDSYEVTYINTGKELIAESAMQSDTYDTQSNTQSSGNHFIFDNPLIIGNPSTSTFPPLPYAEKEAHMVAEYLNTTCYTGENADISLFDFNSYRAPSLLHVAAHGVFNETEPFGKNSIGNHSLNLSALPDWNNAFDVMEHSGLLLADDALLSCNQISTMELVSVRLAVLSACRTGKGFFHSSEGVYGLRRAFKLAGCHAMIISLWQVDDRSGYYFMRAFYENLVKMPENPRRAFSLAVESLRCYEENNTRPFEDPYYWAGYIFIT